MSSDNSDPLSSSRIKNFINSIKKTFTGSSSDFDADVYEQLDPRRKEMIDGVITLSELNAKDIMIPRVDMVAVDAGTELKALVKIIIEAGHSRLPVYDETVDNITGILYVKDLIKLLSEKPKKFSLKKLLHEPFFVPETMPLDELLVEFKGRQLHLAVVVDEYGGVGGIVTMEDILEVIVGDINDEYDTEELPEIEKKGTSTWEADSRMLIADFNDELGLNIPTEDFDTIGGFVFDLFGRVPEKDETVKYGNISFKIKEIEGTKIIRITVTISRQK
ncbi:MAG: HlyC/CorC family transporter [Spirochaetes bacterium]|nr:HlyC/CorC family transporter [Spirochaetota bacterium]